MNVLNVLPETKTLFDYQVFEFPCWGMILRECRLSMLEELFWGGRISSLTFGQLCCPGFEITASSFCRALEAGKIVKSQFAAVVQPCRRRRK